MRVVVRKGSYAIVKALKPLKDAFAVIQDGREITVIIEQSKVDFESVIESNRGWKILTFDAHLPFDLVGFLAKISGALAEEGISILALSSYSTDHILVKEENLDRALKKLKNLGFRIAWER